MIAILVAVALVWGGGALAGVPRANRVAMLGGVLVALFALAVILPETHPFRPYLGGARDWIQVGVLALAVAAYVWGFRKVKARAQGPVTAPPEAKGDDTLERYARHIVLREIGGAGQARLGRGRVLVVGAGGLGAPVLLYLGAAGVGTLGVIDDDAVAVSNLQRQVIFDMGQVGQPKVFAVADRLAALNPGVAVRPYNRRFTDEIGAELVADYDLVIDGTDDPETRAAVNRACVARGVPLLSGAIAQWEGQVSLFDPRRGAPCYACLFPDPEAARLGPTCAEGGVAGPLPGVIGTMLALEAVKELAGAGQGLRGRLLIWDGLWGESRTIEIGRRDGCAVCGDIAPA